MLAKVGLSLSLVLPGILQADYSLDQLQKDGQLAKGILPVSSKLKTGVDSSDDLDAVIQKIKSYGVLQQEELENIEKGAGWNKKINAKKGLKSKIKAAEKDLVSARGLSLNELSKTASRVASPFNSGNPADFSTGDLPQVCRKGVDLQQFKSALDSHTAAGKKFASKVQDVLEKDIKENEADVKARTAQLFAEFEELATNPNGDDPKLKAEKVPGIKGAEMRNAEWKNEILPKMKAEDKASELDLVKTASKFFQAFAPAIGKSDKEISKVAAEFAASLEQQKKSAIDMALKIDKKAVANCKKQKREAEKQVIKTSQALAANPNKDAQAVAFDTEIMANRVRSLQCNSIDDRIIGIMNGAALSNPLTQIVTEKSPKKVMAKAVEAMQAFATMQAQLGQEFQSELDECFAAATAADGLSQRAQAALAQMPQAQQGKTANGASSRNASFSSSTARNGSGSNSSSHSSSSRSR